MPEQKPLAEKNTIYEYSCKWLELFNDVANHKFEVDEKLQEDFFKLGFTMDCGHLFEEKYGYKAFNEPEAMKEIIGTIDDIEVLTSGIFSYWRGITHWSYEHVYQDKHVKWFVVAITRLKELCH